VIHRNSPSKRWIDLVSGYRTDHNHIVLLGLLVGYNDVLTGAGCAEYDGPTRAIAGIGIWIRVVKYLFDLLGSQPGGGYMFNVSAGIVGFVPLDVIKIEQRNSSYQRSSVVL
jgi:hypothetical protein